MQQQLYSRTTRTRVQQKKLPVFPLCLIAGGALCMLLPLLQRRKKGIADAASPAQFTPSTPSDIKAYLQMLQPSSRRKFETFLAALSKTPWRARITSGYRTYDAQQKLRDRGNTLAVEPGYSPHNYGIALDFNFSNGHQVLNSTTPIADWMASGIPTLAKSLGMRWGGAFRNADRVHFDTDTRWSKQKATRLMAIARSTYASSWASHLRDVYKEG